MPTPRIGLRLMFLLMALACVLVAYLRAVLDLRRETAVERLFHLSTERDHLEHRSIYGTAADKAANHAKIVQVDAEIAELRQQVDAARKPAN